MSAILKSFLVAALLAALPASAAEFVAKLASDERKPDGMFVVRAGAVRTYLDHLLVERGICLRHEGLLIFPSFFGAGAPPVYGDRSPTTSEVPLVLKSMMSREYRDNTGPNGVPWVAAGPPNAVFEVLGGSGVSESSGSGVAPGPIHEKCIGSFDPRQSPPQQNPASRQVCTNHSGMSEMNTASLR